MVMTLAAVSIRNPAAPSALAGTYLTSIPKVKVITPAQTASSAVANEMSVGSKPLSMKSAIL